MHHALRRRFGRFWPAYLAVALFVALGSTTAYAEPARNGTMVTILAGQDATVRSTQPTQNFGKGYLAVDETAHSYVQFDLSTLPPTATIERALLRLQPYRLARGAQVEVTVGRALSSWVESRITWDNRPRIATGGPTAIISLEDPIEFSVTSVVQQWHSGELPNHGLAIYSANPGQGLLFHSRETAHPPELVVFLQSQETPGLLTLDHQVDTGDSPVRPGDLITYTLQLGNQGGTTASQAELRYVIPSFAYLAPGVYIEETSLRADPLAVRIGYELDREGKRIQVLTWRGTLQPDADLAITVPVYLRAACTEGASTKLASQVQARVLGEDPLSATTDFDLSCPQATLSDVGVVLELGGDEVHPLIGELGGDEIAWLIGAGGSTPSFLRATLRNTAADPVIVGYRLTSRYIGETEKNTDVSQVILRPGETRVLELPLIGIDALRRIVGLPDTPNMAAADVMTDDEPEVAYAFDYAMLPYVERGQTVDLSGRGPVATKSLRVRMRAWDFGDAPDSTNHHGNAAMTAYPNVQAHFPTVYASQPSAPGPAHVAPRHFHLGRGVSLEMDADLGASPNIHPPGNAPDRDLFDDGAAPHLWNLHHCRATTIDVRVFISPEAAAWFAQHQRPGYLNGWIDGTRDGDWDDTVRCDGTNGHAFEHFIIDHLVDAATLGAGYHTLKVPSRAVLWPADKAQQPAWVRLTLSERTSAKTGTVGGIDVGDGRGHADPFRLGETEDYLLAPSGSADADMTLSATLDGGWQWPITTEQLPAAVAARQVQLNWVAGYANLGSLASEDMVLIFEVPAGLDGRSAAIDKIPDILASRRITVEEQRIIVELGRLQPGQRGQVVLSFRPEIGDEVVVGWTATAELVELLGHELEGTATAQPNNTIASFKVEIEGVTQGAFGFRSPGMEWLVQRGTTNSSELTLQGFQQERTANGLSPVKIWVHQVMVGMGQKDAYVGDGQAIEVQPARDGRWSHTLRNLPDGFYQFAVGDPAACDTHGSSLAGNDNEWRYRSIHSYGTACGMAVVDSSLPVDPISLGFVAVDKDNFNQLYRVPPPDTLDWGQGEWRMTFLETLEDVGDTRAAFNGGHVEEDIFYRVRLNGRPGATIALERLLGAAWSSSEFTEVAPGRYETLNTIVDDDDWPLLQTAHNTSIAAQTSSASLRVESDGVETHYDGTLAWRAAGEIRDAETGATVAGATVLLLAAMPTGDAAVFVPWVDDTQDQANPITTNATGVFGFVAPEGVYHLQVSAPGYQPYRTAVKAETGLVGQVISLTAAIDTTPQAVIAITENGFEPALRKVKPESVVAVLNATMTPQSVQGVGWDSGLLLTGERTLLRVGATGTLALRSGADPSSVATLIIDPAAEDNEEDGSADDDEDDEDGDELSGDRLFVPVLRR